MSWFWPQQGNIFAVARKDHCQDPEVILNQLTSLLRTGGRTSFLGRRGPSWASIAWQRNPSHISLSCSNHSAPSCTFCHWYCCWYCFFYSHLFPVNCCYLNPRSVPFVPPCPLSSPQKGKGGSKQCILSVGALN